MTHSEQYSDSVRYLATQYIVIPQPDGTLSLYTSYGSRRIFRKNLAASELGDFFTKDFITLKTQHDDALEADLMRREARRNAAQAKEPAKKESLDDLDLSFNLSDL